MTWYWDKRRRVYVTASGVTLSKRELNQALEEYIESIQANIAKKASLYARGLMTVGELFSFLDEEISAMHGASGSIAYGGLNQMDARKWERINNKLSSELAYLNQFKTDVHTGLLTGAPLSTEGIVNRAGLYAEAAYSEYLNQVIERESDEGVNMGRRIVIGDDASCEECVAAATEEFIPLDQIPQIGTLQCMHNCRCEIEFSVEGTKFRPSEFFSGVVGGQEQYGGSVEIN